MLDTLCIAGESNQQIAKRLGLTESTIKFHLGNAMLTSGIQTRTGLALWWLRKGRWPYFLEELEVRGSSKS